MMLSATLPKELFERLCALQDAYKQNTILNIQQFNRKSVLSLMNLVNCMHVLTENNEMPPLLSNKILAAIFYEPSTRTSASFISAMYKLGGSVLPFIAGMESSSVRKGETVIDTVKTIAQLADIIVLRHPEKGIHSKIAAEIQPPLINAGDGHGEHPTQALLDLYTILREKGQLENLTISIVGDLLYGRTVHSLIRLLHHFPGVHINLVSPKELAIPREYYTDEYETESLEAVIADSDVLYVTRMQRERFKDPATYDRYKDIYHIEKQTIRHAKDDLIIMHPLPRVNEIDPLIDSDTRAVYFKQVKNGLYTRMALMSLLLFDRKSYYHDFF